MAALPIRGRILRWLRIHRFRLLCLFAGVLIPLYAFGVLAEDVLEQESFFFDLPVLLFIHSHANESLDRIMIIFSMIGSGLWIAPIDVLVLLILAGRRRWGDALFCCLAVGGSALLNVAAKHSFGRIRPDLWPPIAPETTFSFPSGHAMQTMALVAALVVLAWPTRWRSLALVAGAPFILMVGLSRVYLGVHYPSDILAGWAASLVWVVGLSLILYGHLSKPDSSVQPASAA